MSIDIKQIIRNDYKAVQGANVGFFFNDPRQQQNRLLGLLGRRLLYESINFQDMKIVIDLQRFRFRATVMTLCDYIEGTYEFDKSTFNLFGSNNCHSWKSIRIESYVKNNFARREGSFELKSSEYFQYFKIEYGRYFRGNPLSLSGIEMYGYLI